MHGTGACEEVVPFCLNAFLSLPLPTKIFNPLRGAWRVPLELACALGGYGALGQGGTDFTMGRDQK